MAIRIEQQTGAMKRCKTEWSQFQETGEKRRTAIWNYWEAECVHCGERFWIPAGSDPSHTCPNEQKGW